jgi:hypothetical protein
MSTATSGLRSAVGSLAEGLDALRPAVTNADLDVKLSELTRVVHSLETHSQVEELLTSVKGVVRSAMASLSHEVRSLRSVVEDDDVEARLSALGGRVESLCTRTEVEDLLAVSTSDLRSVLYSTSDHLQHELTGLQGELQRLNSRVPSRPRPTVLDETQLNLIAESIKASMRRPAVKKAEGGTSPVKEDVAKARVTKTTKGATARRTATTTATKGTTGSEITAAEAARRTKAAEAVAGSRSAPSLKAATADAHEVGSPRKARAAEKTASASTTRGAARPRKSAAAKNDRSASATKNPAGRVTGRAATKGTRR